MGWVSFWALGLIDGWEPFLSYPYYRGSLGLVGFGLLSKFMRPWAWSAVDRKNGPLQGVSHLFAFYCDLLDSLSFRISCRPNIKENPLINIVSLNCQVCTTYAHHIDFSDQHMQCQKIQLICLTLE